MHLSNSDEEAHLDPSLSCWSKDLNMSKINVVITEILAIQKASTELLFWLWFDQFFPKPVKPLLLKFLCKGVNILYENFLISASA